MENEKPVKQTIHSLFTHPENRHNFELFYKVLSQSTQGLCLCQVMPEERLKIFGFFNSDPLIERIHMIDMVHPLCDPTELQLTILDAQKKHGNKKDIFFIYNFESCIYLSKTSAEDFFQKLNLIRDFFMKFHATFVFFVTESSLKKMIQNAFDFYDWIKFTFTFVPEERERALQTLEIRRAEEQKYSFISHKIRYLKDAIKKVTNEQEKAVMLNLLAGIYRQEGDYDSALERLLEALVIDTKNCNLVNIAKDYSDIGFIYKAKGDLDRALEYNFKALEIDIKNKDLVNMARDYNDIGMIHKAKGDLDKALEYSFKALEIDEENNDHVNMAIDFNNIGQVYQDMGDLDKALEYSFKALEIDEKNNDLVNMAIDFGNIGQIYKDRGDLDKALEFTFKALEIDEKNNDLVNTAIDFDNIGQIYKSKGDLDIALDFAFKALEIVGKINDRVRMAKIYSNIGKIYRVKGDNKKAEKYFKRAKEIEESISP